MLDEGSLTTVDGTVAVFEFFTRVMLDEGSLTTVVGTVAMFEFFT